MNKQNAQVRTVTCIIPDGILELNPSLKRTVGFHQTYPGSATSNYMLQSINEAYLVGVQKGVFDGRVENDHLNRVAGDQQLESLSAPETDPDSLFPDCIIPEGLLTKFPSLRSAVAGLYAKTIDEIPGKDILRLVNNAYSLGVSSNWKADKEPITQHSLNRNVESAQNKLLQLVDDFMQNGSDVSPVQAISDLLHDWLSSGTVDLTKRYNVDQLFQAMQLINFMVSLHQNYVRFQTAKKGGQGHE